MTRHLRSLIKKAGLPPGTVSHVGPRWCDTIKLIHTQFNPNHVSVSDISKVSDIHMVDGRIHWVDMVGLHNSAVILDMGSAFHIHSLILEDISNTTQLPKLDEHEDSFFILLKAISFDESDIHLAHIALVIRPNMVISFQERSTDTFAVVRQRILNKTGKIIHKKEDYLMVALFDYVIDSYFSVLRHIDEKVNELTIEVDDHPNAQTLKNIQHLKKQVLIMKRYFWITRDIVLSLKKTESPLISKKTHKYLIDLYDHIAHIIDISESFREELIDLSERHLSAINMKSNDIMKILTIVAAIFMPLTFLVGIYGMNFTFMPELSWKWGYPVLMVGMVVLSGGLLWFFNYKKWLD